MSRLNLGRLSPPRMIRLLPCVEGPPPTGCATQHRVMLGDTSCLCHSHQAWVPSHDYERP